MRQRLLIPSILLAFMAIGLWLRGLGVHEIVIGNAVRYVSPDSWHYARLMDSILANWPHVITFDPYIGDDITVEAMTALVPAAIAKLTNWNADIVASWMPVIYGVLTAIPVYFIGKVISGKWAGLISAGIVVVLPGELMGRTAFSHLDHHALEILASSLVLMFLLMAVKWNWKYIFGALGALVLYIMNWHGSLLLVAIILICLVLRLAVKHPWYAGGVIGFGIAGLAIGSLIMPELWGAFKHNLGMVFETGGAGGSISETVKLDSWQAWWVNFNVCAVLGMIGYGVLIAKAFKERSEDKVLLVAWMTCWLILAYWQRRFTPYLAVCIASSTGYLCWLAIEKIKDKRLNKKEAKRKGLPLIVPNKSALALAALSLLAFVFYPSVDISARQAHYHPYMPSTPWIRGLDWLKDNSPEPFNKEGFYYANYDKEYRAIPLAGDARMEVINKEAYRVMSWWDYGHWIVRIAQRPVLCSPAGGRTVETAKFFVESSEEKANEIVKDWNIKYIVVDYDMVNSKFYAMPLWADVDIRPFTEQHYQSMVWGLYYGRQYVKWKLIWESAEKIKNVSVVKIFQYQEPQPVVEGK